MIKIPFDIKYRPQIESGEYKVCIDYDWPVEILSWDCIHVDRKGKHFPILAKITCMNPGEEKDFIHWYNNEGKYDPWDGTSSAIQDNDCIAYCPGHDLFIVTPEEELSEWQRFISACLQKHGLLDCGAADRIAKESATELLALAREQFIKDGYVIEKKAFHDAVEKVSPEVMKAVLENVDKENEELTEFEKACMKLYNEGCDDGLSGDKLFNEAIKESATELIALARKELIKEGTSKNEMGTMLYDAGFEDGKAEAFKALPRWKKCAFQMGTENPFPRYLVRTGGAHYSLTSTILKCDEYIPLSELAKLPKEDGHE